MDLKLSLTLNRMTGSDCMGIGEANPGAMSGKAPKPPGGHLSRGGGSVSVIFPVDNDYQTPGPG